VSVQRAGASTAPAFSRTHMLSVKNFDKFQHYRDRAPAWIKLYSSLLEDYEFSMLPDAAKSHLLMIWLLASKLNNSIPNNPDWIRNRINASEPVDVALLIRTGFLVDTEQDASKMLQTDENLCSLEERREREEEKRVEAEAEPGAIAQPPPKPKLVKPKPEAKPVHVAIQTCREVAKQFPPKELWDKLITTLGDTPNTVLLAECRAEWVERGYNRASWKWATEWYQTGVPPRVANSPPKQASNAYVGKSSPAIPASVEGFRDTDAYMAEYVDKLITDEDFIQLGNEYDAIIQRGGAKAEWEIRVVTWYELHKDEPATPEQVAQINASINALVSR